MRIFSEALKAVFLTFSGLFFGGCYLMTASYHQLSLQFQRVPIEEALKKYSFSEEEKKKTQNGFPHQEFRQNKAANGY